MKGFKAAVLSKQTRILWGLGETDADALHDAYKWLNQDHDFSSYEDFMESKTYDDLILFNITPTAAARGNSNTLLFSLTHQTRDKHAHRTK